MGDTHFHLMPISHVYAGGSTANFNSTVPSTIGHLEATAGIAALNTSDAFSVFGLAATGGVFVEGGERARQGFGNIGVMARAAASYGGIFELAVTGGVGLRGPRVGGDASLRFPIGSVNDMNPLIGIGARVTTTYEAPWTSGGAASGLSVGAGLELSFAWPHALTGGPNR